MRELSIILNDCQSVLLLCDAAHEELATTLQDAWKSSSLLTFCDFPGEQMTLADQVHPFTTADGEEPVLILYTSDTTGLPKGVMLSQRMITWNAINTQISWGLRETDIALTFAPFFHAGGFNITGYAERGLGLRQGYGLTEVGVNCFSLGLSPFSFACAYCRRR